MQAENKIIVQASLTVYLFALAWLLFFYEDPNYSRLAVGPTGTPNFEVFKTVRHYLFVIFQTDHGFPIKSSAAVNLLGNIALFIPMGVLLPIAFPSYRKITFAFFMALGVCLIEFLQWVFQIGIFDVDDILLNATGCFIGLLLLLVRSIKWE